MSLDFKRLVILYGSQSGNSQDLAERTWRQAKYFSLKSYLCSLNDYNLSNLGEDDFILFVCATTGQGDVPDNMNKFWKGIMRKSLPSNCLEHLTFSIVGLGDSSYPKFNFVAKKLQKRLIQLGANMLLDSCLCDEQSSDGHERTYSNWMKQFWSLIGIESETVANSVKDSSVLNVFKVSYVDQNEGSTDGDSSNEPASETKPYLAKVLKNTRVTADDHWQNVRLIELDCSTNRISYSAGDVLMIQPSNLSKTIKAFYETFEHLNLNPAQQIKLELNYKDEILVNDNVKVNTVCDLVEKYLDLNSVPRMTFFELFSKFSTDELEREKLLEFLSPEGREDLYDYCYRPRRTIIEIFQDFSKTTKNIQRLDDLLDLVPCIKPRAFSIASSPSVHKSVIQILVAVVEYKTRLFEKRLGTCSNWLASLDASVCEHYAPIWIKKGSFDIDWQKPLICVGPGTGVAPFRSMILERINKFGVKENYLYFGSRSRSKDFYFENEWKSLNDSIKLHTAFSRDQEQKVYVQDKLRENSNEIFQLIHKLNATILIAGSANRMPQDVLELLRLIIETNYKSETNEQDNDKSKLYSEAYIKDLETKKRIQMETWS